MSLPVSPTDSCAPPTLPAPSPSSSLLPPKDVAIELQGEIRNLQSEDESTIMKAAASILMLSTLPEAEPHLEACVGRLSSFLIGNYSVHVQRNACAALTSIMNATLNLYQTVAETPDLMKGMSQCLKSSDSPLQINALATISVLSQEDKGLALIEESGIDDVLLSILGTSINADIEEALVDTFCALAAHENMRPSLLDKGVIPKLAAHLGSTSSEVSVRVLLALGMMCGSSVNGQNALAASDGAVTALLRLMKSDDHDIKSVARELFGSLILNQEARIRVEQEMRNS